MAQVIISESYLTDIANAIRSKTGTSITYKPSEMSAGIRSISGGGITPTGTISITENGTYDVTQYAGASVAVPTSGVQINNQDKTVNPSTSQQQVTYDSAQGYTGLGTVTVTAMPTMTLPTSAIASATSGYTSKATIGRSTSNQYINIPPGYNSTGAYYLISAVANGTAGTPTATKGTVSNHSISVTPSVTNTTGYITGSTKTGTAVTVSASELVSGSETKTANGTYDVTNLASLVVNVSSGGSSNFTLLGTLAVGTISTSSTTATNTNKSITVKGIYDYDFLVCECSVDTKTNNRHACTTRLCWLTASSTVGTKDGATFATATWNCKLSSTGTATTRSYTTAYGVYANGCTVSAGSTGDNGQAVITIYQRYNSTYTGTINGAYTMRVYGVKIYDLIGG